MIYIENNSMDPAFNLAMEEYLLMSRPDLKEIFLLWQDEPTVVVGRNQNTLEEINLNYVKTHGVHVVRRLSGGGAVYHDQGNLNFTFIVQDEGRQHFDFRRFTRPVIKVLQELKVPAEDNGRNDITIDGKKFSGNAQVRCKNRLLHHGTLLFDSSIREMVACLQVGEEKFASKAVKSVSSRVTNISEHLSQPMNIGGFKKLLLDRIWGDGAMNPQLYKLSEEDLQNVQKLRDQKYSSWDWNFGSSPAFDVQRKKRYEWGQIDLRIRVSRGLIKNMMIYGDFFANTDMEDFGVLFQGIAYNKTALRSHLETIELAHYIPHLDQEDLLGLLFAGNEEENA